MSLIGCLSWSNHNQWTELRPLQWKAPQCIKIKLKIIFLVPKSSPPYCNYVALCCFVFQWTDKIRPILLHGRGSHALMCNELGDTDTVALEIHWSVNSNTIQCDAPTNWKIVYCDNTLTHLHSCALKETGATTVLEDYLDNDHHVTSISEIPPTHHSHSHSLVRGKRGIHWPTFSTGCTSYTVQRQAVITPPVQQGMRRDPRCLGNRWTLGRGGARASQVD